MTMWAFEDFYPGLIIELPAYYVSEQEMLDFAKRYDPQPMHSDATAAKATVFEGLIASGWLTTAIFMRMQFDAFIENSRCLASPGVDEIRWLLPVRPGDTLTGANEVVEVRPSTSKPDRGAVFSRVTVNNQQGETVMTLRTRAIFFKADA